MKKRILRWLLLAGTSLLALPGLSASPGFQIAVIAHPVADEGSLRDMLASADASNLAFVVAGGIKSPKEACSDDLYERRKNLFDASKNGLILSVAGSDWSECRYSNGRTAAVERLNRIRELFFDGDFSLGASKLPLIRQSANAKFRGYGENVRWEFSNVLFATLNLPSNNNHYLTAAGRNGEFEDRVIANQDWLQRLFTLAIRTRAAGIVLFCDGAPLSANASNSQRDGFTEVRRQLAELSAKFSGKVLVVHNPGAAASTANAIVWNGNLGNLALASGWIRLAITPSRQMPFRVIEEASEKPDAE